MKKHTQKEEIFYNVVNSILAGAIAFFSSLVTAIASSGFDSHELLISAAIGFTTSFLIALYKFKEYWDGEKSQYQCLIFKFI
jgi:hypothetical protein